MSIKFMIVIDSTFLWLLKFHIYEKSIEFVIDFMALSRSEEYHEINDDLEFCDAVNDRREYEIMLSVL